MCTVFWISFRIKEVLSCLCIHTSWSESFVMLKKVVVRVYIYDSSSHPRPMLTRSAIKRVDVFYSSYFVSN